MFKWLFGFFYILIFGSGKYQNKEKPLKRQKKTWTTLLHAHILNHCMFVVTLYV